VILVALHVRVLGPFEVLRGDEPIPLRPSKSRDLLALLTSRSPRPVSLDVIIDELWRGVPPRSARKVVQKHVSELRRGFGAAHVATVAGGYALRGLSVDSLEAHRRWSADIEETQGHALNFPLIADPDRVVSDLYGMIHPNASDTMTVRSVFVIGPDRKIKLTITYPQSTGRNFFEIVRVIDSLQLTAAHKVSTPVNWSQGDDVIIVPAVSDDEARTRFPDGWQTLKPYLRLVPQPR
jgi:DNA-binding winged helix-turn-helix (wHTH) protein